MLIKIGLMLVIEIYLLTNDMDNGLYYIYINEMTQPCMVAHRGVDEHINLVVYETDDYTFHIWCEWIILWQSFAEMAMHLHNKFYLNQFVWNQET